MNTSARDLVVPNDLTDIRGEKLTDVLLRERRHLLVELLVPLDDAVEALLERADDGGVLLDALLVLGDLRLQPTHPLPGRDSQASY